MKQSPKAATLLAAFKKEGLKIEMGYVGSTGAGYERRTNTITIDPDYHPNLSRASSALLYELLRVQHAIEQEKLDNSVIDKTITKKEVYAEKSELLSYNLVRNHAKFASEAIAAGFWQQDADIFGVGLRKGYERRGSWWTESAKGPPYFYQDGIYSSFPKYLERMKKYPVGAPHYDTFENRFFDLLKKSK